MAVGGGTGNTISFSEIRDFYGDSNPVVFSDFERKSSNDGLVDATFAGADTVTTTSGSGTKNDFVITSTDVFGSPTGNVTRASPYTVTSNDATVIATGGTIGGSSEYTVGVSTSISRGGTTISQDEVLVGGTSAVSIIYRGPAHSGSGLSFSGAQTLDNGDTELQTGDVVSITSFTGSPGYGSLVSDRRPAQFDVTFKNNSSTGDTYTLASSSTRQDSTDASQLVYSAQTTRQVKDNSGSGQWTIAYDNITGAGAGTAGDIGVSILGPNYTGTPSNISIRAQGGSSSTASYTITVDDCILTMSASAGFDENPGHTWRVTRSGSVIFGPTTFSAIGGESNGDYYGDHNAGAYGFKLKGPAYISGDQSLDSTPNVLFNSLTIQTGDVVETTNPNSTNARITSRRRDPEYTTRFTNNSGSNSYTLVGGSGKTTGGAATLTPGATRDAKTNNTSSNPSWAVHFDTSSGNCNVGIPTTIGSGNPANINLFNTLTTPVG